MAANPFQAIDFSKPNIQKQVVAVLVTAFQNTSIKQRKQKAFEMLSGLFEIFSFSLPKFCQRHELTDTQRVHFLSYLLSVIYYDELLIFNIPSTNAKQYLDRYLFTLLPEAISEKKIRKILAAMPLKDQLKICCHCLLNPREGAWVILNVIEAIYQKDSVGKPFFRNLRSKYYSPTYLTTLLDKLPKKAKQTPDHSRAEKRSLIKALAKKLEAYAEAQIRTIMQIQAQLIELIIISPTRGVEDIERLKQLSNDGPTPVDRIALMRINAELAQEQFKNDFAPYRAIPYTFEEFRDFFQTFGLSGFFVNPNLDKDPNLSLSEQLEAIFKLFQTPIFIKLEDLNTLVYFVFNFCKQLHSFVRKPLKYAQGLDRLVYSGVTLGTDFSHLPWLPSVLTGLTSLIEYLRNRVNPNITLSEYPLVVFDQAPDRQFSKNAKYVRSLEKKFGAKIWHLSSQQTIRLAEKLGVVHWIKTTPEGVFGFGGARNCEFFLAPIIFQAAKQGKRTIEDILETSDQELSDLFDIAVLGKTQQEMIIHLGEDDVAIPACDIFTDALSAEEYKDLFFFRRIYCIGRGTSVVNSKIDLENVLTHPEIVFYSTYWKNEVSSGGMKGMITKPRFCLPLPYGSEEGHVITPFHFLETFSQPIIHLGGTRFPKKLLPTSPQDGMLNYLKDHLYYNRMIGMSAYLIDANSHTGRNILPWNDKEFRSSNPFRNLKELWNYISLPSTRTELQERFWRNLESIFNDFDIEEMPVFIESMRNFAAQDLSIPAPAPLKRYYEGIKHDAQMFFAFAKMLVQQHREQSEDPVALAKKEVEEEFKLKIAQTELTKGLLVITECILSFGSKPLREGSKASKRT